MKRKRECFGPKLTMYSTKTVWPKRTRKSPRSCNTWTTKAKLMRGPMPIPKWGCTPKSLFFSGSLQKNSRERSLKAEFIKRVERDEQAKVSSSEAKKVPNQITSQLERNSVHYTVKP